MDTLTLGAMDDNLIPILAIAVGGSIAVISIVLSMISCIVKTKQREQTKRELAAYVAEGSMTPQDAERMLKAAPPKDD